MEKTKAALKKPSLWNLIILISFGTIGGTLFTPAIPAIVKAFNTSFQTAQLTVTIYLAGYSISQLFYSPLAKRFGRKVSFYIGISIAIFGSFLSALSGYFSSLPLLLLARFLTSLGSSVGLSLTFLLISDFFSEKEARKVTAYTMIAFAIIPGLSIAIGGFLVTFLCWESCFYFLGFYGFLVLYLVSRLEETGTEKESIHFRSIIKNYCRDSKKPILLLYSLIIGSTTAMLYTFATNAPIIAISYLGIKPNHFGMLNLIPSFGYFLGNFFSAFLSHHFDSKVVVKWGIFFMGMGVCLLLALLPFKIDPTVHLFSPTFILYFSIPLIYSNATVLATFRSVDKPNASCFMSFINIGFAFIALILIDIFPGNRMTVMSIIFLCLFLFISFLFLCSLKWLTKTPSSPN